MYIYINYKSIKSVFMRLESLLQDSEDEELNVLSYLCM